MAKLPIIADENDFDFNAEDFIFEDHFEIRNLMDYLEIDLLNKNDLIYLASLLGEY